MLSKIAGHEVGVAKKVNPIAVRVPKIARGSTRSLLCEHYLEGASKVLDDVGEGKQAVVNLSIYCKRVIEGVLLFEDANTPGVDASDGFRIRFRMVLRDLIRKGVIPVTGSGNNGHVSIQTLSHNHHLGGLILVAGGRRMARFFWQAKCRN